MNFNEKVDKVDAMHAGCRLYVQFTCYNSFGVVFDNLMHRHDASFFVE